MASAMAVLVMTATTTSIRAASPDPAVRALRFETSALAGGGFYNTVALAPAPSSTILLGGGNSGFHRSTDLGASSEARNKDLLTVQRMRLASIVYHPTRPGVVYAAAGDMGRNGGFERSFDDGLTWEVASDVPRFAGQDNSGIADLPRFPRSTGTLIAATGPADDTTIWAATFRDGVMRSRDDGATWEPLGLDGLFLRTIALDPDDPDVLYTAAYGVGVYMTTNARDADTTFTRVTAAPIETEELAFIDGTLYAAAGTAGLFRADGTRWIPMTTGVPEGSTWTAITGYAAGTTTVLLAGCHACGVDPDGHPASIVRSVDGGATWRSVTRPADLDQRVVGSGERWVLADAVPELLPGGKDAIVSQLVARPDAGSDPAKALVLMAGRGGMWRSTDGGATWAPAVNGLSDASSQGMVVDPQDPTRIYQGAGHFGLQFTDDAFATVRVDVLGNGTPLREEEHPAALWTAFDVTTTPSTVIIGGGDTDIPTIGGVYLNTDPFTSDHWEDLGYTAEVPRKQPTSLAVGHDAQGVRVIVAAAHPKGGLVRKVGDGPWTQVADPVILTTASPARSDMLWVPDTQTLFFYDLAQGIFRSDDGGLSWSSLWAHPSKAAGTGAIAVGPAGAATLFVAAEDGLFRVDGADAGAVEAGTATVTRLGSFPKASDVSLDRSGTLWATLVPDASTPVAVVMSRDPGAATPTFETFTSDLLQGTMVAPETLVVTDDGVVLVGGSRSGTIRGIPATE